MDFGSFENTIDKNIETDKASDKFDQQLQAYKDAGNSLTSAKSELETAVSSLNPNRSLENDKKLFLMTDLGLMHSSAIGMSTIAKVQQKYITSKIFLFFSNKDKKYITTPTFFNIHFQLHCVQQFSESIACIDIR